MSFHILVGSYANEIYTLLFDPSLPSLKLVSSITVGFHPSWITPHPSDKSVIFTGLEQEDGKIVVLKYDERRKGTALREISSGGADPCSLLVTEKELFIGNYSSGHLTILPVASQPPFLQATSSSWSKQFNGTGPDKTRQESSHPHQVVLHPNRKELLVPDLGADRTWRLGRSTDGTWELRGSVEYKPGSGPRHVAIHGETLYTVCELTNTLTAHHFPTLPSSPSFFRSTPTTHQQPPLPSGMLASEILIPPPTPDYPQPFIYVANRNDPSNRGDTISIFDTELKLIKEVSTGLKHLRGMEVNGKWLVAGGVNGGGVKVFERAEQGRGLKEIAQLSADVIRAPTGFLWV